MAKDQCEEERRRLREPAKALGPFRTRMDDRSGDEGRTVRSRPGAVAALRATGGPLRNAGVIGGE